MGKDTESRIIIIENTWNYQSQNYTHPYIWGVSVEGKGRRFVLFQEVKSST